MKRCFEYRTHVDMTQSVERAGDRPDCKRHTGRNSPDSRPFTGSEGEAPHETDSRLTTLK
jgi:hypothetical protein